MSTACAALLDTVRVISGIKAKYTFAHEHRDNK
jgi:hypothetical protein